MRVFLTIVMLLAFTDISSATGKIEIWSYAFVTLKPNSPEPIAGDGASLFKPNRGWLEGPMNAQNGSRFKIRFALSGKSVTAVITAEKGSSAEIQLDGTSIEKPESDGKGCSVEARLTNGVHYVVLQHYVEKCST